MAAPFAGRDYYATLMLPFFAYGVALLGFNLLFGVTGLLSFGHALFVALGAYTAAFVTSHLGILHFDGVLVAAAFVGLVVAIPVGLLCVRYVKIYFGMLTLAFGMLFYSFLYKFYAVTGGDEGMRVLRPYLLGQAGQVSHFSGGRRPGKLIFESLPLCCVLRFRRRVLLVGQGVGLEVCPLDTLQRLVDLFNAVQGPAPARFVLLEAGGRGRRLFFQQGAQLTRLTEPLLQLVDKGSLDVFHPMVAVSAVPAAPKAEAPVHLIAIDLITAARLEPRPSHGVPANAAV
jgi:hypothetical protein